MVRELERLHVRLKHREKFVPSNHPLRRNLYAFCGKCEFAIIIRKPDEVSCPQCGTTEWIEFVSGQIGKVQ